MHERVLSFLSYRGRPARQGRAYREIDFVVGSAGTPKVFVEIKTITVTPRERGTAQLESVLNIARCKWPHVRGVWLQIFLGGTLEFIHDVPVSCVEIDEVIQHLSGDAESHEIIKLWIDGSSLVRAAQNQSLLPDDFLIQLKAALEMATDSVGAWLRSARN
jgi:hypothetical protein